MPRVPGTIPNLINGVSQQAPAMRLPSQAELSENYMPSIVDGLIKRPRTDHNANLGSIPTDAFTHIILRDEVEKYVAVITTAGAVRVFDMAGVEKTVTNSGASYLSGLTSAKDELTALTIADHTFIVNKKKVAAAGSTTAATRPFEALINVQAGNYAKTYRITINGTVAADFTTPDGSTASHGTQIATDYIADQLLTDLIANGYNTSPWAVGRYHSAIYIRNTSTDFTLGVEDGYAGRAMKDCKGKVQKFSDLPLFGPDGVVFEISGTEDTGFDNYWVRFEKANNANTSGVWKETTKPGSILGLNAATMPHILRRNVDGTFTFLPWTWGDRKCGDDVDTVPNPSFVGQTIADIFFHRNRLGLLTSENTVMSEAGVFGNFFRTTLTALLDTDPIDVAASHTKVSLLNHAVPYQDVLLLFSDKTQFRLAGNELLTPKTVNIRPLTELSNTPTVKPVVAASSVYFASENDEWCNLYEYFIDKQLESADADEVSSHAPAYVPSGVHRMEAAPDLNMIVIGTDGDPAALYLYKFYWAGQEKLQSAWVRWPFPNASVIVNFAFDKAKLRMLVRRGASLFIETLNFAPRVSDDSVDYLFHGDQHAVLTGSYSSLTNLTTFTLPYTMPTGLVAVVAYNTGGVYPDGLQLSFASSTSTTFTVAGDVSGIPVHIGVPYRSVHRLSPLYFRGTDGKQAKQDGRLTVNHINLVYTRTAYFRVEVTPEGREKRTYTYNSAVLGSPETLSGQLILQDGHFAVPVMSRNDRVVVDIINDTWLPSAFTSAEWRGIWNPAAKEI